MSVALPCALAILAAPQNGPFAPPLQVPMGTAPGAVAVADLDGDGTPDLAAASSGGGAVNTALGLGAGAFGAVLASPTGAALGGSLALADLDGDGLLDAIVGNQLQYALTWLRGDGSGHFVSPTQLPAVHYPTGLAVADADGDGAPDILTVVSAGSLVALLGDGHGAFQAPVSTPVGVVVLALSAWDRDGDGKSDVAATDAGPNMVRFLKSLGGGAFLLFGDPTQIGKVGVAPLDVTQGRLNDDVAPEVVTANAGGNSISVLLTLPWGYLQHVEIPTNASPNSVVLGDADHDGAPDALVAHDSGTILLFPGDGAGGFGAPVAFTAPGGASRVALADLDGDGRADMASSIASADVVLVWLGAPGSAGAPYGSGTPGCRGSLGMAASEAPRIGTPGFRILATNAPANALGLGLVTDAPDAQGSDPLGVGVLLHVDLFAASELLGLDARSDPSGCAFTPAPIPNDPSLIGRAYYAQTIWVEAAAWGLACGPSPFRLVSSRGLALVIQ